MVISKVYPIQYDGQGKHRMLNLAKLDNLLNIASNIDDYSLAEYFFNQIAFLTDETKMIGNALSGMNASVEPLGADNGYSRQIKRIHLACEDEIKSRQAKPQLTEQQASNALFEDLLQTNLDELAPRTVDVAINL